MSIERRSFHSLRIRVDRRKMIDRFMLQGDAMHNSGESLLPLLANGIRVLVCE